MGSKCIMCGKKKMTNLEGRCMSCHKKYYDGNEQLRQDNEKKLGQPEYPTGPVKCPACRKDVDKLKRIREFSIDVCHDCSQKFKKQVEGNDAPTEAPRRDPGVMIVQKVQLTRGRERGNIREHTRRFDGDRLVQADDETLIKKVLDQHEDPRVEEVSIDDISTEPSQEQHMVDLTVTPDEEEQPAVEKKQDKKKTGTGRKGKTRVLKPKGKNKE